MEIASSIEDRKGHGTDRRQARGATSAGPGDVPESVRRDPVRSVRPSVAAPRRPTHISCLRVCGRTGKNYFAHYTADENWNHFYSTSGIITREMELSLNDIYRDEMMHRIERLGIETCVHCGVSGEGCLFCSGCNIYYCWGSTIDNRYGRCPRCVRLMEFSRMTQGGSWGVVL